MRTGGINTVTHSVVPEGKVTFRPPKLLARRGDENLALASRSSSGRNLTGEKTCEDGQQNVVIEPIVRLT
jgi:hypothetical protein